MSGTDKDEIDERRGEDRRDPTKAYSGEERRVGERRSGKDRRQSPRIRLVD